MSINATVSFTVPQALAVAEAVERGLQRREREGLEVDSVRPACTLMIGRIDDWLKAIAERDDIAADPTALNWAGSPSSSARMAFYRERGYRTRLLAAAFRHRLHWTELVGGDIIMTLTHQWQVRFNESGIDPEPRIDTPVDAASSTSWRRVSPTSCALRAGWTVTCGLRHLRRHRPHAARFREELPRPGGLDPRHRAARSGQAQLDRRGPPRRARSGWYALRATVSGPGGLYRSRIARWLPDVLVNRFLMIAATPSIGTFLPFGDVILIVSVLVLIGA